MFDPQNNPRFIVCVFVKVLTIIDCLKNTKLYVSDILELNKYTIIGHLGTQLQHTCHFIFYIVASSVKLINRKRLYLWFCIFQ